MVELKELFVVFNCWNCIRTALELHWNIDYTKTRHENVFCDHSIWCNARKCAEDTFGGLPRPSRTEAAEVFSFLLQNYRRVRKIELSTIPIYSESNQRRDTMGHFYILLYTIYYIYHV